MKLFREVIYAFWHFVCGALMGAELLGGLRWVYEEMLHINHYESYGIPLVLYALLGALFGGVMGFLYGVGKVSSPQVNRFPDYLRGGYSQFGFWLERVWKSDGLLLWGVLIVFVLLYLLFVLSCVGC